MAGRGSKSALNSFLDDLQFDQTTEELDLLDHGGEYQEPTKLNLIPWACEWAPKAFPGWVLDEPTRVMLEAFEEALKGKDKRVLAVPSPRTGKTTTLVISMVWSLFRYPVGNPQILLGGNQRNASNIAKKVLTLFAAAGGKLHPKSKSSTEFAPGWADGMTSQVVILGRTTSALGYGAAALWLDDVVTSRADSMSPNFMADTAERLGSDWMSRLQRRPDGSGSCLINIAQRLSNTDLASVCIQRFKKRPWTAIHIPTYGVERAEILDLYPDAWKVLTVDVEPGTPTSTRFDPDWLNERKLALSPAAFQALMMCDVSEDDTLCAFRDEYLREIPRNLITPGSLCLAIDAALTAGGDATGWAIVGTGAYELRGKLLVLEGGEWRADVMDLIPNIVEAIKKYKISSVVVEKAGGGLPLLQTMNRHIDNFAINIEGVSHRNQNKRQRLEAHLGMMSLGNVLVPQGAAWLPLVRRQLRDIALDRNVPDDVGDAVVHGLTKASAWLAGGFTTGTAEWGRGAAFIPRNQGIASWGRGASGFIESGGFETPADQPFPQKPSWER